MKRRNFLKRAGLAAGAPIALQGIPFKVLGADNSIQRLAQQSTNDKVLVILRLSGGNDGLNTFIPIDKYDEYEGKRRTIAIPKGGNRGYIPLDSTVRAADQVGLHPEMQGFKELYDNGNASVFQGVSYENPSGSHFRGTDVMFMGGDAQDFHTSGWVGRYLQQEYQPLIYPQDFPNDDMQDPLALEMGNDVSLVFHQNEGITTSISMNENNPKLFSNQVDKLSGFGDIQADIKGTPPEPFRDTLYGKAMDWILEIEDKSRIYSKRLEDVYGASTDPSVTYPGDYPHASSNTTRVAENDLAGQLQMVARLLGAGIKTKVFLVKIGGFDTHSDQVEGGDSTIGIHGALMYHLSGNMKAFQDDLKDRGLDDRVMTVTLSEFGRRIQENGSLGSDHGTGGPMMLFGKGVNPGIYGTNPDLSTKNVEMQFDYRQIYANILREWMGVEKSVLTNDVFYRNFIDGSSPLGGNFEPLDLTKGGDNVDNDDVVLSDKDYLHKNYHIKSVYPNPATTYAQAEIFVNNYQNVRVNLTDTRGKVIAQLTRSVAPGSHTFTFLLKGVKPGIYFIQAKSEMLNDIKRIMVRK